MANGRFLSRTIATDKRLSLLSLESEFLFLKTIPHLDRDGLILADVLWSTVAPRRLTLAGATEDLWREWVNQELAIAYETNEGAVLFFPGFTKNQQGMRYDREAPSRYEPPPGYIRTDAGLVSATTPDQFRTNSGPTPPQGQVQEQVEVKERGEAAPVEIILPPLQNRHSALIAYEHNVGFITPILEEHILTALKTYPEDWVLEAIDEAPKARYPSWSYIDSILKRRKEGDGKSSANGVTSKRKQKLLMGIPESLP